MSGNLPSVLAEQVPGLTYRQLDYWTRRGYVRPHDRPTDAGSGHPRSWPAEEVEVLRRMARLTAAGLTPKVAATVARQGPGRHSIGPGVDLVLAEIAR